MSLLTMGIVNGILAVAIVAALVYVCRIPYDGRVARPKELPAGGEALKQPQHPRAVRGLTSFTVS